MPQFDFFSFFVQIFWLVIAACVFHLLYLKLALVRLSQVIKMREKLKAFSQKSNIPLRSGALYDHCVSSWFKRKN